jgi:hypothetical protein
MGDGPVNPTTRKTRQNFRIFLDFGV